MRLTVDRMSLLILPTVCEQFAWSVLLALFLQRSGWCLCAWAAETRSMTSTSCGSPLTWSGTPPVSNVPNAASTWTSPARASSGKERRTVNGTTSGRTTGTEPHPPPSAPRPFGIIILIFHNDHTEKIRTDFKLTKPCFYWAKGFEMLCKNLFQTANRVTRARFYCLAFIECILKTWHNVHRAYMTHLLISDSNHCTCLYFVIRYCKETINKTPWLGPCLWHSLQINV